MAQKFHFAILRIEITRASRGLSAIAELLVLFPASMNSSLLKVWQQNPRLKFSEIDYQDGLYPLFMAAYVIGQAEICFALWFLFSFFLFFLA